jgi:hypothetical protein
VLIHTQERVVVGREEGAVGRQVRAPARAPHALEERRDTARCVDLDDVVEIADVDAELECARGDNDAVGALLERLLGGGSLRERQGRVREVDVNATL